MKQHAITLAHGTYTELKDTEGAKGTEDKLLWLDIQGTSEELTHFLKERQIPPFLRRRVLSSQRFPSVFSGNDYVLLSVPARKTWVQKRSVSITFILFAQEVITLCRDEGYNFDGERKQLAEGDTASIRSASDLLIALLDSLVETNICNFIEARSQTENLSLHVDNASGKISEQTILDTRRQINHLVNQFEDFFYGLADLHALTPHAMLSDAVREKLRPESGNITQIAMSAMDDWGKMVEESRTPAIIIIEGLTMYLSEADVQQIFAVIANRFDDATVLVEIMNPMIVKRFKGKSIEGSNAKFTWGIKGGKALAALLPNFRFVEERGLMEDMTQFMPIYKVLDKVPAIRNISNKIITLKRL